MKKLLLFLFSLLISFNSYGGLFDKTICLETLSQFQVRDELITFLIKPNHFLEKTYVNMRMDRVNLKEKLKMVRRMNFGLSGKKMVR